MTEYFIINLQNTQDQREFKRTSRKIRKAPKAYMKTNPNFTIKSGCATTNSMRSTFFLRFSYIQSVSNKIPCVNKQKAADVFNIGGTNPTATACPAT
jgi:hypothetical protein